MSFVVLSDPQMFFNFKFMLPFVCCTIKINKQMTIEHASKF